MTKFFPTTEYTPEQVCNETPWAYVVISVEGGYMAFESADDYATWLRQS